MIRYLIIIALLLFLSSCMDLSIDSHEHHMTDDCKCEEYGTLSDNFYIADRDGSVQTCGKTIGASIKWGFIIDNDACDEYLPFIYEEVEGFNFGLAPVKLQGKWGVIDSTGKKVIDFKYRELSSFSDSLATFVDDSDRCGFINTHEDTIIQPQFTNVHGFWANLCFVYQTGKGWHVYNSKGQQMPVQIDSLIDNYHTDTTMLSISYGRWHASRTIYNETIEYPFYSNGAKVKLVGFRNKYAILPDTVDTSPAKLERELATSTFKPIFK